MAARAPEGRISAAIVKAINGLGPHAHARKVHGSPYGTSGEPDIDACVSGRAVKLEVKVPGRERTVTKLQAASLRTWERAGAVCGVVTSVDDALALLARHAVSVSHTAVEGTRERG